MKRIGTIKIAGEKLDIVVDDEGKPWLHEPGNAHAEDAEAKTVHPFLEVAMEGHGRQQETMTASMGGYLRICVEIEK